MATVTREQRAIEAWAKAMATAENYAVDPHQHIARLVEAGEQMAALLAPKDAAALASPPASDPPGLVANWRPIETAPKRTDVLAGWADRPHWLPQVLQQDDAGMWFNGEESDYRPPTHWMPLPASPQAKED